MYTEDRQPTDDRRSDRSNAPSIRTTAVDPDIEQKLASEEFPIAAYVIFHTAPDAEECTELAELGISSLQPDVIDQHCQLDERFDIDSIRRLGMVRVILNPDNIGIL